MVNRKSNKKTGGIGELKALKHLEEEGYEILGKNVELFCGEIDILAKDKRTIVLVEVKTVRGEKYGSAQELVRYKKQEKLKLLARALEQEYPKNTIRIDVIGVHMQVKPARIEHLENAVY